MRRIDLDITRGDKIALIGNNGSGKTTLSKLMAGCICRPRGSIDVDRRVLLLRGVGTGVFDELDVSENLFLYGIIYGMERSTIREKFDEVLEWAELTDFASAELRTLSSGMRARLAFSLTRHFDTDIFLLDEAFAVGDKDFRAKYEEVFRVSRRPKDLSDRHPRSGLCADVLRQNALVAKRHADGVRRNGRGSGTVRFVI